MSKRAEQETKEIHYLALIEANRIAREQWDKGYKQSEKDTIDRACEWLFSHLPILMDYYNKDIHEKSDRSEFIRLFRKSMEEQK